MFQRKDPAQLQAQLQSLKGTSSFNQADGKEWKLALDPQGNGSALIRFLPGKGAEGLPFVKLVNHFFKGTGKKYYSENCSSTHGDFDNCPVCKHISENDLYNTDKAAYGKFKRKTSFWANILVVKDPTTPENEGKVFKYRFGQKVMDKINAMVEVDTSVGETPVDVTCPWDGANFVLKVKQVGGFSNYDESKFAKQTAIPKIDDEAFQTALDADMFDLATIASPDQFKPLDKLTEEFKAVLGTSASGGAAANAAKQADALADELDNFDSQMAEFNAAPTQTAEQPAETKPAATDSLDDLLDEI
jgi:hypothetical protein